MKECAYYTREEGGRVRCSLCPHRCLIAQDKSGICGARENLEGTLVSRNYGVVASAAVDPVEKKPLYHYYPGSMIFSVGTAGCNLHCPFCQNYTLSRYFDGETRDLNAPVTPEYVMRMFDRASDQGEFVSGIAYTYSEPVVWFEFVRDVSRIVKDRGGKNVLVTNGFINHEPLDELIPLISAANVDLKTFTENGYARLGGSLAPVKSSIEKMVRSGWHVELTTLVVTDLSDSIDEIESAAKWIASIDRRIPYHLSRYFPQYKYNKHATDLNLMREAHDAARTHLDYVYMGNLQEENDTLCPGCGKILVRRNGYHTTVEGIENNKCISCGRQADIII